jgi:hypothetical protein
MFRVFLVFCGILFSFSALAGTRDPRVPDSKYIEYGSKFKCVLKICGKDSRDRMFCASAVAIKPHWIITAAHVVKDCHSCIVNVQDKSYCVTNVIYHQNYEENIFGYHDIAVGYVEEDLGLDFYPELYSKNDEVDKICSISGFGLTGTFNTGISQSDNNRRAGSNIIDKIDRNLLICTPSVSHRKTELEFLIGSGDSGGGLFIDNKLAGINSCVISEDKKPDSTYTDESGHTRVSYYVEWVNSVTKEDKK